MSLSEPVVDPNKGHLIGGTAFQRCGQIPVKGSGRCYSLAMMHQRLGVSGPLLRMADMSPWFCTFINSVWKKSGLKTKKTVIKLKSN